jgi:hypothetical protein
MTNCRLEALYLRALRLYPAVFRDTYAEPMRQSFADALADNSLSRHALIPLVLRDLAISLIKEHFAMLRETYSRPVLLFNALVLAAISTVLALALYVIPQQVLRDGANDPQVETAKDVAAWLGTYGVTKGFQQGPFAHDQRLVDISRSLSLFLIVYDDEGHPLGSTAQLEGQTPVPPAGVFNYVRSHGEERVTWRPASGVRIAAVVERVNGNEPGFVLAGRSLSEVQARIDHVRNLAALTWLGMLGLILAGTLAFGWMTRRKPTPATV